MRSSDHTPPLPVFSQNGLQQLVAGTFGGCQTGSLRDLVEKLRNTAETPSTLPRRSQLQVVQQRLQAQYDVTPENGTPAGIPSRQQLAQVISEITRYESQLSLLPPSPTQTVAGAQQQEQPREALASTAKNERAAVNSITTISAQQRAAQDTAAQLKPLLAHHTIFTASPAQRVNLLSHFHALSNSDLRFAQPQTQSELASFINQRETPNASSRLDQLQIMTAFLRGSPNAAISSRINTLLSSQLAQDMTLEQFLVPRAAGSISGNAVLAQFANLTPEAKTLFLLRLARATLTICQLITSELASAQQRPQSILGVLPQVPIERESPFINSEENVTQVISPILETQQILQEQEQSRRDIGQAVPCDQEFAQHFTAGTMPQPPEGAPARVAPPYLQLIDDGRDYCFDFRKEAAEYFFAQNCACNILAELTGVPPEAVAQHVTSGASLTVAAVCVLQAREISPDDGASAIIVLEDLIEEFITRFVQTVQV